MKKEIFTLVLIVCTFHLFAQKSDQEHALEKLIKLDLGLRGVGFAFEPRLSKKMTIDLSAGLGGGYNISDNSFEYNWDFLSPALYLVINPKFYYNREKRIAKEKDFSRNAGNYIGLVVKYTSRGIAENSDVWDALLFNLHWGLQRPVGKRWIFNTHFGGGYAVDATDLNNSSGTFYPALDIRFAYILNEKN